MQYRPLLVLVLAVILVVFVLQNAERVQVHLLFWQLQAPRALVLLGIFAIGVIIGWIGRGLRRRTVKAR